jgi:aspartate oxidase
MQILGCVCVVLLSVMATLMRQQSRGHHHTADCTTSVMCQCVCVPQYLTAATTHGAFIWLC